MVHVSVSISDLATCGTRLYIATTHYARRTDDAKASHRVLGGDGRDYGLHPKARSGAQRAPLSACWVRGCVRNAPACTPAQYSERGAWKRLSQLPTNPCDTIRHTSIERTGERVSNPSPPCRLDTQFARRAIRDQLATHRESQPSAGCFFRIRTSTHQGPRFARWCS